MHDSAASALGGFVLILLLGISACAPFKLDLQLPELSTANKIQLKVKTINVNDKALEEKPQAALSSGPFPIGREVQRQFHKFIITELTQIFQPYEDVADKSATITLKKSVITMTNQYIKAVPFLGFLFLGMDEEYVAFVEGSIEIEDRSGRVISVANFETRAKVVGKNATDEQVLKNTNLVASLAIVQLREQIKLQSNRYLYDFIAL